MGLNDDDVIASFKILILGDTGVGKSSLLLRFTNGAFIDEESFTVGVDFKTKKVNIDDNIVRLALWDTAGQERFRALIPTYYRDAHAAILVYDVTRQSSLKQLNGWIEELNTWSNRKNIVKMIIGNKTDMVNERMVEREDGLKFASRHKMSFLEASARTSDGVNEAFEELIRKVINTPGLWEAHVPKIQLLNDEPPIEDSWWCGCRC